jgi:hypothetical protein
VDDHRGRMATVVADRHEVTNPNAGVVFCPSMISTKPLPMLLEPVAERQEYVMLIATSGGRSVERDRPS